MLILFYFFYKNARSYNGYPVDIQRVYQFFLFISLLHICWGYETADFKLNAHSTCFISVTLFCFKLALDFRYWVTKLDSHIVSAEQKLGKVIAVKCFKDGLINFSAGQYSWIRCLDISKAWHAIHISSCPEASTFSFHIAATKGKWSDEFYKKCGEIPYPHLQIGCPSGFAHKVSYGKTILICAGDGIHPAASVASHFVRLLNDPFNELQRVEIFWIIQENNNVQWFYEQLCKFQKETRKLSCHVIAAPSHTGSTDTHTNLGGLMMEMQSFSPTNGLKLLRKKSTGGHFLQTGMSILQNIKMNKTKNQAIPTGPAAFDNVFDNYRDMTSIRRSSRRNLSFKDTSSESFINLKQSREVGVFYLGGKSLANRIWTMCKFKSDEQCQFRFHYTYADDSPPQVFNSEKPPEISITTGNAFDNVLT